MQFINERDRIVLGIAGNAPRRKKDFEELVET